MKTNSFIKSIMKRNNEQNGSVQSASVSSPPSLENREWTPESIKQLFSKSADFIMDRFELGENENVHTMYLLYCEGLTDTRKLNEFIIPQLEKRIIDSQSCMELDKKWELIRIDQPHDIVNLIYSGYLLFYFSDQNVMYAMNVANPPHRQPTESNTEIAIKGAKDAFVEEVSTNVALVRKRLRSNSLCYEQFTVGARSQSKVALLYIEDICQPRIVDEVRTRLQKINLDLMFSGSQMEELLADRSHSLFPLLHYTTRPDFVVDSLTRGRFAVLVDGAPTAVIGPANLTLLLKTPEDAYIPFYIGTFGLFFRFIGLVIALLLPGFWIALASYNIEQIPYPLLATIAMSRIGLPIPAPLEGFLMMIMFELFREAGERLPKAVGQTVAVVGGIVVGDAAIRAGLASTTFVVIASITAVASFTLVNQSLVGSVSIIRLFVMLCASTYGIYGFILSLIAIVCYLSALESFGVPYLAPLSPIKWKDLFLALLRIPWDQKKHRPEILQTVDDTRQKGSS